MAQIDKAQRDTTAPDIPDKLYFRIGDVAALCSVPAYVLRFWETEFPQLKPNKGGTGQRLYRRRDVEVALRIKRLLYEEGYTIPGARQALKTESRTTRDPQLALAIEPASAVIRTAAQAQEEPGVKALERLRKDLQDLHALLSRPPGVGAPVQSIRGARLSRVIRPFALLPAAIRHEATGETRSGLLPLTGADEHNSRIE